MSAACIYEADTGLVLERHTDAGVTARFGAGVESWHVFRALA